MFGLTSNERQALYRGQPLFWVFGFPYLRKFQASSSKYNPRKSRSISRKKPSLSRITELCIIRLEKHSRRIGSPTCSHDCQSFRKESTLQPAAGRSNAGPLGPFRGAHRGHGKLLRPRLWCFDDRSGEEVPERRWLRATTRVCNFVQTSVVTEEHRSGSSHHNQGGSVPKNRGKERCHGSSATLPLERG
jgi:hypothetical protein